MHTLFKVTITVVIVLSLLGCALDRNQLRDPFAAAAADTITTSIALAQGATEMNPLGPVGALAGKGVYLFGIRPRLSSEEQQHYDRVTGSLWFGAATNNLVQIISPGSHLVSIGLAVLVGWYIYRD